MTPATTITMTATNPIPRNVLIAVGVVVFHVLALWALQSGLLHRAVEVMVPVQLLAAFVSNPTVAPASPAPTPILTPALRPVAKIKTVANRLPPVPVPMPLAIADPTPAEAAPVGTPTPQAPAPALTAPVTAPVATYAPAAPPAPPAPQRVELPSSNADYLQNPKPQYPSISKRLGEQGQVVHSVLIGTDGLPVSAHLIKSSGYDRLDQAAHTAVMRWRYVPGKRNGIPTTMSFNVPINWVLE
jgi:protein TonB